MGEENVGKILSAPQKVSSYVVYSNFLLEPKIRNL